MAPKEHRERERVRGGDSHILSEPLSFFRELCALLRLTQDCCVGMLCWDFRCLFGDRPEPATTAQLAPV